MEALYEGKYAAEYEPADLWWELALMPTLQISHEVQKWNSLLLRWLFSNESRYFKEWTSRMKHHLALILLPSRFNNSFSHAPKLFVTTVKWFLKIVQHHKKAFIHIQSHGRPLWKHKWLWFVLACNTAISEETRARLVRACNYCFCLLLRTAPNYPPQTWKSPNYRRKAEESKTWNITRDVCNNCFQVHFMLTSC